MIGGEILKTARMLIGANITEMADNLGVSYRTYKKYENGGISPDKALDMVKDLIEIEHTLVLKKDRVRIEIDVN